MASPDVPQKTCKSCGRSFSWRKKWERCWDDVRYCSDRCRREKPAAIDAALESAILERAAALKTKTATFCPSEATRAVGGEDWRALNERTRRAARRLAEDGRIEILQGGKVVDPATIRGPIRLRLRR